MAALLTSAPVPTGTELLYASVGSLERQEKPKPDPPQNPKPPETPPGPGGPEIGGPRRHLEGSWNLESSTITPSGSVATSTGGAGGRGAGSMASMKVMQSADTLTIEREGRGEKQVTTYKIGGAMTQTQLPGGVEQSSATWGTDGLVIEAVSPTGQKRKEVWSVTDDTLVVQRSTNDYTAKYVYKKGPS